MPLRIVKVDASSPWKLVVGEGAVSRLYDVGWSVVAVTTDSGADWCHLYFTLEWDGNVCPPPAATLPPNNEGGA